MNFNYFLDTVKNKYADFNGRARRQEFWMYILFYYVVIFGTAIVDAIVNAIIGIPVLFLGIAVLGLIVPTLAVTVRRLHDISKSGWYIFVSLIPFVGGFYLLYLLVQDGTPGSNEYGANPKEVSNI